MSLLLSLIAISCKKQEAVLDQVSTNTVTSKDGRLIFSSLDDFKNTITSLKKMNGVERDAWEGKMGHNSMFSYYTKNEGVIVGNKNPIYKTMSAEKPYIFDILFARIVNSDGIFQIGTEVHKINKDGHELVTNEATIASLHDNKANSDVKSHPISVVIEDVMEKSNNAKLNGEDNKASREIVDGHYARAYFARSNYFLYNSFAMKLRVEKEEGWWIFKRWNPKEAQYLEITHAGVNFDDIFMGPNPSTGSSNCSNCSESYAFLLEVYGPNIYANIQSGGSFKATYNNITVTFAY